MKTPREILERLFDDAFNIEQAIREIDAYYKSKVTLHDCEKWRLEGMGCSVCGTSHFKTIAEMKEVQEHCNWRISELNKELDSCKSKVPKKKELENLWEEFINSTYYHRQHGDIEDRKEICQWGFKWFLQWLREQELTDFHKEIM